MSTPTVPTRPSRSTATASAAPTAVRDSVPPIPPRPTRKLEPSPNRDNRSPFNETPNPMASPSKRLSQSNLSAPGPPQRPPNVTLPSVGQEGSEYASFDQLPPEAHGVSSTQVEAPEQTINVSENMPLHAPKASFAQSTAKSRIETVTRTDSTQAAAAGIGKPRPDDDVHKSPAASTTSLSRVTTNAEPLGRVPSAEPHPLRQRNSFSHSTPTLHPTTSRPGSIQQGNDELGIPEIGMQIPLNPNAGDVQAPSPAPTQSQFAPGVGYFNDGSARAHNRKRSAKHEFGPPGSYGLHSHGQEPQDRFERDWAAKNPDRAATEGHNAYGTPRPETAYTSAQLNRLVSQTSDVGLGTDPNMIGIPGEDTAWGATEEYTARESPKPFGEQRKRQSSGSQPAMASPLRNASYPWNERKRSNEALVFDDGDTIHVDPAERKYNKVTGGGAVDGTLDLGPQGGNTEEKGGWYDERGEGTPILASDEIVKRPGSAFMQPAVDPEAENHNDDYDSDHQDPSRRSSLRVPSRPSSRPNSVHGEYHGGNLYRFMSHEQHDGSGMHTPLEEIEEYEPLIPSDEEDEPKPKPKEVKKRPGLEHHHFPSQDVWEDTPMSLRYQTTVETPEPPVQPKEDSPIATTTKTFETPEEEQQRRYQNTENMFSNAKTLITPQVKKLQEEVRPGMAQRFPSRDIWEDTPDSMLYSTTVSGPQMDEAKSPPDDRPTTTAIPGSQDDSEARATTGLSQVMTPQIPARPSKKSKLAEEMRPEVSEGNFKEDGAARDNANASAEQVPSPTKTKPPAIPDRPKPTVPTRPARTSRGEQANGAELAKSISADSGASSETVTSPPIPKAKPAVPARPAGEKIAALKSGFMNDLNNRLKLGPQGSAPKAKEVEPEVVEEAPKAPLTDARKGRAKGPARRKPAASPSASVEDDKPTTFSMSAPLTLWQIDESDQVQVPSVTDTLSESVADLPKLEQEFAANVAHNTAEPTLAEPMSPEKAEARLSQVDESVVAAAVEKYYNDTAAKEEEPPQPEVQTSVASSPEDVTTAADVEEKELAITTSDVAEAEKMEDVDTIASEGEPTTKETEGAAE